MDNERVPTGKLPLSEIGRLIREHSGLITVGVGAVTLSIGSLVYRVHAHRNQDGAIKAELEGPINPAQIPPSDNL